MARPPKCVGCEHCDIWKVKCALYPQEIPNDILLEYKECAHYKLRIDFDDSDDDLPLAKGR